MTTLRYGSRGDDVKALQTALNRHGYTLSVDGIFGRSTENAVRDFQAEHDLSIDGIVGTKTWNALNVSDSESHIHILIDNGHGVDTAGKHSPDMRLREYAWAREIATCIVDILTAQGYDAQRIVTEERDISLTERVRRVNAVCAKYGSKNCVLVSVHNNAAGADGKWHNATGWCGYVAPNASDNSKRLAKILYEEAAKRGLEGNRSVPYSKYWVGDFTVIKRSNCPAVLTENLFQDNLAEVDFLLSEQGKQVITSLHVDGIKRYIASL